MSALNGCAILLLLLSLGQNPAPPSTAPADDQLLAFLRIQNKSATEKLDAFVCEIESSSPRHGKQRTDSHHIERLGSNFRYEMTGEMIAPDGELRPATTRVIGNAEFTAHYPAHAANVLVFEHESGDRPSQYARMRRQIDTPDLELRLLAVWNPSLLEHVQAHSRPDREWRASEISVNGRKLYAISRFSPADGSNLVQTLELILDPDQGFHVVEFRGFATGKLLEHGVIEFVWSAERSVFVPKSLVYRRMVKPGDGLGVNADRESRWTVKSFSHVAPNFDRFQLSTLGIPERTHVTVFDNEDDQTDGLFVDGKVVPPTILTTLDEQRRGEVDAAESGTPIRSDVPPASAPSSARGIQFYLFAGGTILAISILGWQQLRRRSTRRQAPT